MLTTTSIPLPEIARTIGPEGTPLPSNRLQAWELTMERVIHDMLLVDAMDCRMLEGVATAH